jgi:hypothetical protein
MRTLCILFSLTAFVAIGQRKFELRELKGTFREIRSGQNFAYEVLSIDIDGETRLFRIDPVYGQTVLKKLKPGTGLTFKALVDDKTRETLKNMKGDPINWVSFFGETIDAIHLDGVWISTPYTKKPEDKVGINWAVLLEQIPGSEIREVGIRKGLIFPDGFVAFSLFARIKFYSMEGVSIGKPVSFIGYESLVRPEYLYPIENVKRVVSFMELKKQTGKIESFIYKQNFARIGLKLNGERYSFPVELAQKVERFATNKPVTIYYHGEGDAKANLLPTIHAFVQGQDTLKIPRMYYGDPDGRHEHKPTELDGKITQVNRSDRGHIISLVVANDCYVEVDPRMATQLKDYLNKGKSIKISGLERIKKDGEIYERNYRIITPQKVEVNGKEFILNK